jgi:hypothetical protein
MNIKYLSFPLRKRPGADKNDGGQNIYPEKKESFVHFDIKPGL